MELKNKIQILRMLKNLPRYSEGNIPTTWQGQYPGASLLNFNSIEQKYSRWEDTMQGVNMATSAIGFAGAAINAFGPVKGQNELLADAGTSYAIGNGFGYTQQNGIDASGELSELNRQNVDNTLNTAGTGATLGGSIGSIFGPIGSGVGAVVGGIGGLITGLFGSSSRKDRLRRKILAAEQQSNRINTYNRSAAHSDYLAQQYNYNHAYTQDDLLYGAKHGKDCGIKLPGFAGGYGVYTSGGISSGPANSRVAYGETIYNPSKGEANIIKTGKLDADTNLSYLQQDDVVFGNHIDWNTGMTFRDEALPFAAVLEKLNKK